MKFIHNKIEYTKLESTDNVITYTDNINLYQVNIDSREGISNTGKSLSEIYKLGIGFNPTKFIVDNELMIVLLKAIQNSSHIRKTYQISSGHLIFIKDENHLDDELKCLLVGENIPPSHEIAIKKLLTEDKEIPMKEYVRVLKKSVKHLIGDELLNDKLFRSNEK